MSPESNALGFIAAVIFFCAGMYLLRRGKSFELSRRSMLGLALVLAAVLVVYAVSEGVVGWLRGVGLVLASVASWIAITTRHGRRKVGLGDWGITTHTAHLDVRDEHREVQR